jgi:hypothetical protein
MAFKTFAPGVLTSSDVNTFLMRQSVIVCTAATRPASPNEGMLIYETDTDTVLIYSGSAWVTGLQAGAWKSFTPAITGSSAWVLGNATIDSAWQQVGRTVSYRGRITLGSTSTVSGQLQVTLPVAKTPTTTDILGGRVAFFDDSTAATRLGNAVANSSLLALRLDHETGADLTQRFVDTTVPWTWTTSDRVEWLVTYETSAA